MSMEKLVNEIFEDYSDMTAELSGIVETLNRLQLDICQFDGSETQEERNSAYSSLYAMYRGLGRFKKGFDTLFNGYFKRQCEINKAIVANQRKVEDDMVKFLRERMKNV